LFAKQLKACGVYRHRATRLFNNNNNNNNNINNNVADGVAQATRFISLNFPLGFVVLQGITLGTRNLRL
jgi:hypothetical protein